MKSERKKMIISEIKYWRRNNLLPAHYCDFLITLYSEGEVTEEVREQSRTSVLHQEKKNRNLLMIGLSLLVAGVIGSLFFLQDYSTITLSLTVLLFCVISTYTIRRTVVNGDVNSFLYILCAFLLLAVTFKLWLLLFIGNSIVLIGLLLVNCVLWIIAGSLVKLLSFTLSGMLGILLIVVFIFARF